MLVRWYVGLVEEAYPNSPLAKMSPPPTQVANSIAVFAAMVLAASLVSATDYTLSLKINALASQAGVVTGTSSSLVETSSTNSVPVNPVSGTLLLHACSCTLAPGNQTHHPHSQFCQWYKFFNASNKAHVPRVDDISF